MTKEKKLSVKSQDAHNTYPIHRDLIAIIENIYIPFKLGCTQPIIEDESFDYGACEFELNGLSVKFRVSKITPTKIGQFVTLWKRNAGGTIQPYDISDPFDLYIISTRKDNCFGQFVFPKSELGKQGILSNKGIGGKRGIRVYPPWERAINLQAQRTQRWQAEYFLEIAQNNNIDVTRLEKLYKFVCPSESFTSN